jgi:hypothetical protein
MDWATRELGIIKIITTNNFFINLSKVWFLKKQFLIKQQIININIKKVY